MTMADTEHGEQVRFTGRIGFVVVLILVVVLGVHPPGSTDLYDDGQRFLEHVDAFWVAIHLLAAVLQFMIPFIADVWARGLSSTRARLLGRWGTFVGIGGATLGVLHLLATDTMTFLAFSDTFAAGSDTSAAVVGADLLLRLHASTLLAWVVLFFFLFPALLGVAARVDGRFPVWFPWLAMVASAFALTASVVTLAERQWTTLSETVLFRTAATLAVIWLLAVTWWMRRGSVTPS